MIKKKTRANMSVVCLPVADVGDNKDENKA